MYIKKIIGLAALLTAGCAALTGCTLKIGDWQIFSFGEEGSINSIGTPAKYDEVYDKVLNGLEKGETYIEFDSNLDSDTVASAMAAIDRERPDLFWVDGYTITNTGLGTSGSIEIDLLKGVSEKTIDKMHQELIDKADSITKQIPSDAGDYEKMLFVHDYIISNTAYSHSKVESPKNGLWGTAYGCLVQGEAICQGYAEAFTYLMQLLDIECGMVGGSADGIDHIWNYVSLEGDYYWIDVTWDDPDEQGKAGESILHSYFLVDDDHLLRTRDINEDDAPFVPECSSMEQNYFVRNGLYIKPYSLEAVRDAILASDMNGEIELMFGTKKDYDEALEDLFENESFWLLKDYFDISITITYTSDDNLYIIKINY